MSAFTTAPNERERQESNLHLEIRSLEFYPMNYAPKQTSGGSRIRTYGAFTPSRFRNECDRPDSAIPPKTTVSEGFEPSEL